VGAINTLTPRCQCWGVLYI